MTFHNAQKYILSAPTAKNEPNTHERVAYLASLLGDPQRSLRYVRLAGSNGKSICSALLSSVLTKAGYKVCTLSLSELEDMRENIRYNTKPIDTQSFSECVKEVLCAVSLAEKNVKAARLAAESAADTSDEYSSVPQALVNGQIDCQPTKSEVFLLVSLLFYARCGCDICIVESAHNDFDPSLFLKPPFLAVICGAIPSVDVKQSFKIKSYIQRGVMEVTSAPQDTVAYKMISDTCASVNCRLSIPIRASLTVNQLSLIGTLFTYGGETYKLNLCGRFQVTNAITAIEALKVLRRHGYQISADDEKRGLAAVRLHSRFEVLSVEPTIIADSTYKDEAVETVCESLFDFSEMTGRDISLLLPCEAELIGSYIEMLSARGYHINEIYTLSGDEETGRLRALFPKQKFSVLTSHKAINQLLEKLPSSALLLISGKYSFTDPIRAEILRYYMEH